MTIKTKLFGEGNYNRDEGLDFDGRTLSLNNKISTVSVMIFEEINEADLGKVTELFAEKLLGEGKFANAFKHISFSIPENPKNNVNSLAFERLFKNDL